MRFRGRRLVSLACLLAYLLASAPATASAPWGWCDSQCNDGKRSCPSDAGRCLLKGKATGVLVCADECPFHCGAAGPPAVNSIAAGQPFQQRGDGPSYPGCPAPSGKCHLCSGCKIPFCFAPSVVIQPLGCLGRVSDETFLRLWQPYVDELIRPPIC